MSENSSVTTIHFGQKESKLLVWASSVPKSQFSYIVRQAIKAFLDGNTNYALPMFKENEKLSKSLRKSLLVSTEDPEIYNYVASIEMSLRSHTIKNILSMYYKEGSGSNNTNEIAFINIDDSIKNENNNTDNVIDIVQDNSDLNSDNETLNEININLPTIIENTEMSSSNEIPEWLEFVNDDDDFGDSLVEDK